MRSQRGMLVLASVGLALASSVASVGTALRAPDAVAATVARGHRADVDGDGSIDRVVVRLGRDLRLQDHGAIGTGHYRLVVHLATGGVVSRRLPVDFYYDGGNGPWTPWYGASQIDQKPGQELVLGRTSGAHTTVYTVVTLRGERLRVLDPPAGLGVVGPGWVVNASAGTGMQGWLCTPRGVRARSAVPVQQATRYLVVRRSYVLHLVWHLTSIRRQTLAAGPAGEPPSRLGSFAEFRCPGLPG